MKYGAGLIVMRRVSLQVSRSTPRIGPVKWRGIPWHTSGVFAVGNAQRWVQRPRESVVPARADLNLRIFFSRSRVG